MSSPLSGHAGNLSTEQEQALASFKQRLTAENIYVPETDTELASHDDATLLRFLRARKFDLESTYTQFASTEAWRKQHDINRLFANATTEEVEAARSFYPMWTGRRDKIGIPLYVFKISALKKRYDELNAIPADRRYERILILYEIMWRFNMRLCSVLDHPSPQVPISSTTTVVDLEGVSMNTLWNFRSHLQTSATLATANYPETLHMVVVVNAPGYFGTVWGWIKGWFDEHTQSKVHVLTKNTASKLQELVHIKDIPKCYGGELDWEFGQNPALDEDAKSVLGGEYPLGTWEFDEELRKATKPREDGKRVKAAVKPDVEKAVPTSADEETEPGAASAKDTSSTSVANGDAHGAAPDTPVPGTTVQPDTKLAASSTDTSPPPGASQS